MSPAPITRDGASGLPPKNLASLLVVEDDSATRRMLCRMLGDFGYTHVQEASSGEAALEILRGQEVDVVLVDKNLPGASGLEVIRAGKSTQPACQFILVTGYGSEQSAIEAMDAGAYGYLTKPLPNIQVIVERLNGALRRAAEDRWRQQIQSRLGAIVSEVEAVLSDWEKEASDEDNRLLARLREVVGQLRKLGT